MMAEHDPDQLDLPDFDSLPSVKDMPQGCAWGVFDKNGKKDHLGCLNLLTPSVVRSAFKEARDGHSVSLNWDIGAIKTPGFGRKGLVHKVLSFQDNPIEAFRLHGNDDEIEFNTQCSSQWDSLVHFAHQASGLSYNGTQGTVQNLTQEFGAADLEKALPTLNHWHERGGLVGRGVLLDIREWYDSQNKPFDCFSDTKIHVSDLEECARFQNVTLKRGDILIIRSGFTEELSGIPADEQAIKLGSHKACGVFGSKETAKWFWNQHFAAVAGDAIAFEQIPPVREDGSVGGIAELVLHQYFLSLFGLNIGELWDLAALSKTCKEKGRYSFLLTSVPLNVSGAVGSPPNALAIF